VIRLLVVDDSPLMRRMLADAFGAEPDFDVRTARDGVEAIAMLHQFRPDVVTLDVQMPNMDGLACLDRIMLERPCPVVMLSSLTREGADETMAALSLGAVDFLPKPAGPVSLSMDDFAPLVVEAVRNAAKTRVRRTLRLAERIRNQSQTKPSKKPAPRESRSVATEMGDTPGLVLVGSSTGGPPALDALLEPLPETFPWAVLVAQHMPVSFTAALARRLDNFCALNVVEVDRAMRIGAGCVYIGRGNSDLVVSARPDGLYAICAPASTDYHWHPSVDRLVQSALEHVAPSSLLGVLMTGMGDDGARSMKSLRDAGGHTIAESEETAVVWGMPGALARNGGASEITPLGDIAASVLEKIGPGSSAKRLS
jgi:two-component system chemotaxis response regulator CheB